MGHRGRVIVRNRLLRLSVVFWAVVLLGHQARLEEVIAPLAGTAAVLVVLSMRCWLGRPEVARERNRRRIARAHQKLQVVLLFVTLCWAFSEPLLAAGNVQGLELCVGLSAIFCAGVAKLIEWREAWSAELRKDLQERTAVRIGVASL